MRELHKWKDKVELSLDSRQISFVFLGLSAVGGFVFALGFMVGRQYSEGLAPSETDAAAALAVLTSETEVAEPERFAFQEGLKARPATREGRPEAEKGVKTDTAPATDATATVTALADRETRSAKEGSSLPSTSTPRASVAPRVDGADRRADAPGGAVMAAAGVAASSTTPSAPRAGARSFTLQMKAFAREDEAETFATPFRRSGHTVRIEPSEVRGRMWYRVRIGEFSTWEEALTAKADFERTEHVVAYVVRL